jgi:nitrate reductase gamma subunit
MKGRFEMTVGRVAVLACVGAFSAMFAITLVLRSVHASNDLIVLVFILALAVGGHLAARVVVHYSEKSPSHHHKP